MSELRSAVDALRSEDLRFSSDEGVEGGVLELYCVRQSLEAECFRRLAEVERRTSVSREGYLSTASWLVDKLRLGWPAAHRDTRMAQALEQMPLARQAYSRGEISAEALGVLAASRDAHPEEFPQAEGMLVDAARSLPVRELKHAVSYWRQAVDADRSFEEDEELRRRRRLSVSRTVFGMVRVDGDLDPETGECLITALRAVQDADSRSPGTDPVATPTQRRADALGEICRQWLDTADRPLVAGERPHVTVTVSAGALQAGQEQPCELEHGGPIHPEAARRWACDASISRVLLGPGSEPLDVGRKTPVVPAPMRRAVVVRDRHCRFPGCDRPPPWCDAHHLVHWARGGETKLSNLVLMCRRHHRMVHRPGGFRLEMLRSGPVFRRPSGTIIEDRAPP